MRRRLERNSLSYVLSSEEFNEMSSQIKKGIISFKAQRNDNITELGLTLIALFSVQHRTVVNRLSQSTISNYQEADELAGKCLQILKPFSKKMEVQKNNNKRINFQKSHKKSSDDEKL